MSWLLASTASRLFKDYITVFDSFVVFSWRLLCLHQTWTGRSLWTDHPGMFGLAFINTGIYMIIWIQKDWNYSMIVEFTSKMYLNMYFLLKMCYFNFELIKMLIKICTIQIADIYLLCTVYSGTSLCWCRPGSWALPWPVVMWLLWRSQSRLLSPPSTSLTWLERYTLYFSPGQKCTNYITHLARCIYCTAK